LKFIRGVVREPMSVTVLPLDLRDRALPICSGDLLFRTSLVRGNAGGVKELGRHLDAQAELRTERSIRDDAQNEGNDSHDVVFAVNCHPD
jgi:hypothetical protein